MFLHRDPDFTQACKTTHRYVEHFVQNAITRHKQDFEEKETFSNTKAERYIFLDELVKETDNITELRDQLLNVFLPGHDSTASLLSSTFFNLARKPDIWKKVRKEVLSLGNIELTYEVLKNMTYLRSVLNEGLLTLHFPSLLLS